MTKKQYIILSIWILVISFFAFVGYKAYQEERNTPKQEVFEVDGDIYNMEFVFYTKSVKLKLLRQGVSGEIIEEATGYSEDKEPKYKLITSLKEEKIIDYGNFFEIQKIKCQRIKDIKERQQSLEKLNEPCK